jgi:cytochrome c-type biogenesis protein CcmH
MYKRALQLVLIVFVAFTMLGASDPAAHFTHVGHELMCTCGCSEILLECNHVGCPNSTGEIADLHAQIDAGASDAQVFKFFTVKYGPIALASPVRGGFDTVAWIGPFWKARNARLAPVVEPATPDADALRNRIRDETNYGE